MATNDPTVATEALSHLLEATGRVAVLHGEERVAALDVRSDVDVASELSGGAERRWLVGLRDADLHCVVRWPYDVASTSYFLLRPDGRGAQLDIVTGDGRASRIGLSAGAAVDAAVRGVRFPAASSDDELLYLLVKRAVKRQTARVAALRMQIADRSALDARVATLFDPRLHDFVRGVLGGSDPTLPRRPPVPALRWALDRTLRPVGMTRAVSRDDAESLAARLGEVVPHVHVASGRIAAALLTRRPAVVLRPTSSAGSAGSIKELVRAAGLRTIERVRS